MGKKVIWALNSRDSVSILSNESSGSDKKAYVLGPTGFQL
jgi:hypothetical protein